MRPVDGRFGKEFELSTGIRLSPNCCIVGLAPQSDEIFGGYDQTLVFEDGSWGYGDERLTNKERVEIADYMIRLWTEARDRWAAQTVAV